MAVTRNGIEVYNNSPTTQVFKATHDGEGNRLPYMHRSFISFTYGGKAIEDFNLIVTNTGDRMSKSLYAGFEDTTTTNNILDGQYYWGTHFNSNELSVNLSTDGMSQKNLDDFKEWFAPGKAKELILSEHPNRAIMARISNAPIMEMIPFEEKTSVNIEGTLYETSTTLYKGEISLDFVMDEPYWYAKLNYMPTYVDKNTLEPVDINNINKVTTITDKDMLKIMLEDGIPHQTNLNNTMFLGGNLLVTSEARVGFSRVGNSTNAPAYLGIITGESNGLSLNGSNAPCYLFYSGTAKCYPKIKFTIALKIDSAQDKFFSSYSARYIKVPKNTYANNDTSEKYSYISIGDKKFYFTTPSILTGVNEALYLFKEFSLQISCAELLSQIQDRIHERYSRAWAVACVNSLGVEKITLQDQRLYLLNNMLAFIVPKTENELIPNPEVSAHASDASPVIVNQLSSLNYSPITFIVDSKTGEATCSISVRVIDLGTGSASDNLLTRAKMLTITENVGDMIRSDYLTIEGRDYLDSSGRISTANCHEISSNETLTDVLIFYQNMYL